jgi:MoaA/NifB/PqqE/SkfB family radical SAM enzyme
MANIIITNACNANCSFCFANDLTQQPIKNLKLADLDRRIDFVLKSGLSQIRLTGGEPNLHPQFREIIKRIMPTGLILVLFSNGSFCEAILGDLVEMPSQRLAILINTNAIATSFENWNIHNHVLSRLNEKITLGFTILNPVFDLSPYFCWIKDFGLQRKLRLGLAQPTFWGKNRYLSPKQYKQAAISILINAEQAYRDKISLEFDCGFVRCMFSDQEWQRLNDLGVITDSHCAPNLDIDTDGIIYHCYSIRQFSSVLDETTTNKKAYDEIMAQRKQFRTSGIYPQCAECEERINSQCCAGCLSITLQRFNNLTHKSFSQSSEILTNHTGVG